MTLMDFLKETLRAMDNHSALKECTKGIAIPPKTETPWITLKAEIGCRTIILDLTFWVKDTTLHPLITLEDACLEVLGDMYALKITKREAPNLYPSGGMTSSLTLTLLK